VVAPMVLGLEFMGTLMVQAWKCDRDGCGHVWLSAEKPRRCSKCKSGRWDERGGAPSSKAGGRAVAPPGKRRTVLGSRRAPIVRVAVDHKMRAAGDTDSAEQYPVMSGFVEMAAKGDSDAGNITLDMISDAFANSLGDAPMVQDVPPISLHGLHSSAGVDWPITVGATYGGMSRAAAPSVQPHNHFWCGKRLCGCTDGARVGIHGDTNGADRGG